MTQKYCNMETKFNFNSQICTTREQSRKLLSLGLKKETADICLDYTEVGWIEEDGVNVGTITQLQPIAHPPVMLREIPAWSLPRLWELLGKIKKYEGEDELLYPRISLVEDDVIFESPKSIWVRRNFCSPKGVYENIINCFEELIKEGYFNKEYLV